jgi:hypothetical protein
MPLQNFSVRWSTQLLDALDTYCERVGLRRGPAVRDLVCAALRVEGAWPPGRIDAARAARAQAETQPADP